MKITNKQIIFPDNQEKSSRKRIFIVDDDFDVREALSLMLQQEGYDIDGCSGVDAIQNIRSFKPHLILMDIVLESGKQNGVFFARKLQKSSYYKNVPILFMSALSDAKLWMKEAGGFEYVEKPFNLKLLLNKLKILLQTA